MSSGPLSPLPPRVPGALVARIALDKNIHPGTVLKALQDPSKVGASALSSINAALTEQGYVPLRRPEAGPCTCPCCRARQAPPGTEPGR